MLAGAPAAGSELQAVVVERERPPSRSRCHPGHRVAPRTRPVRALLCKHPLAVIPREWPLMDNRGRELDGTWAFFFAPRARTVSRYGPRRVFHLRLRPGLKDAPCRHMGVGVGAWSSEFRMFSDVLGNFGNLGVLNF